jgi:hypothetical protein
MTLRTYALVLWRLLEANAAAPLRRGFDRYTARFGRIALVPSRVGGATSPTVARTHRTRRAVQLLSGYRSERKDERQGYSRSLA